MREVPKAFTTTHRRNDGWGTRLIAEPNGKKVNDDTMGNPQGSIFTPICQGQMNLQRLYGIVW